MAVTDRAPTAAREAWEDAIFLPHRWGQARHGDRAMTEHLRLRAYWDVIPPHARPPAALLAQLTSLQIWHWNLERTLPALCRAIGTQAAVPLPAGGHLASCSNERWRRIWAYALALRDWLGHGTADGIRALIPLCDPQESVALHARELLGEPTPLKACYVQRFCLTLDSWLYRPSIPDAEPPVALRAAIAALDAALQPSDPDPRLLQAMAPDGTLSPCHYKLFRHFAIILSSIGVGKWRGAMPPRGDGPAERAALLDSLLQPVEHWLSSHGASPVPGSAGASSAGSLGDPTPAKRFLVALLLSLLRAQA